MQGCSELKTCIPPLSGEERKVPAGFFVFYASMDMRMDLCYWKSMAPVCVTPELCCLKLMVAVRAASELYYSNSMVPGGLEVMS